MIKERLNKILIKLDLKPVDVAKKLGKTQSNVGKILKGDVKPASDFLTKFAEAYNVNLNWLLTGKGTMFNNEVGFMPESDTVMIPVVDIICSAGGGYLNYTENVIEYYPLPKSGLLNPTETQIINVRGDSMHPTISDGDKVILDKSNITIVDNKVFVICLGEHTLVKRLRISKDNIQIISDNKEYSPEFAKSDEIRIVGRVIGLMKTLL